MILGSKSTDMPYRAFGSKAQQISLICCTQSKPELPVAIKTNSSFKLHCIIRVLIYFTTKDKKEEQFRGLRFRSGCHAKYAKKSELDKII